MIAAILRRLSRQTGILLLLSLALACVPIALRRLVPDAGISLLLPVILAGAALAWWTAGLNLTTSRVRLIYMLAGPVLIYFWIAQVFPALVDVWRELWLLRPAVWSWLQTRAPVDLTALGAVLQELAARASALGPRLVVWLGGALRGETVQDPAARALAWSLVVWWLGAWAGWQTRASILLDRPGRALLALLPVTALLGRVLAIASQDSFSLWLHLTAVLAILALANYEGLARLWRRKGIDFSESTLEDTLIATSALTATLVIGAYLAYSISLEDIRDRIREWNEDRQRAAASGQGAPDGTGGSTGTGVGQGLSSIHSVTAGPELSDEIVMIIITGERPSVPQGVDPGAPYHYWRTQIYQTYIGGGWTNPARPAIELPPDETLIPAPPEGYRLLRQQVTFNDNAGGHLYWTGNLVRADVPLEVVWHTPPSTDQPVAASLEPFLSADLIGADTNAAEYTAESLVIQPGENALRVARPFYPDWVTARYLALPEDVPERVRALARDLTAGAATPYDRAVAIETYLRQFPYSLDVPAPPVGRDVADYFLFDLKEGYCDYFATTMTVLARAAGLPARFVIGYASGTYDGLAAQYVVTQADSHAWVEIYFPGIGWVPFEPTPSQPAPARIGRQDVPVFTPEPSGPVTWTGVPDTLVRLLDQLWRPVAVAALLYLAWVGLQTLHLGRHEPSESIAWAYRRLRRAARPVSGPPPRSQTAYEYAANLSRQLAALQTRSRWHGWLLAPAPAHVADLTELYARSLFSARVPGRDEARAAHRSWSALGWRLGLLGMIVMLGNRVRRTSTD